ncbi:PREDICTED: succinate dehydrogenase cytochrome b560 subunit, mitochondrial-like [Ceratosolen solmsi marchali]|uniref:Succinate dehydrogenase cytochrome b560 subunit, mitochondrial-like n=1 Tax=Ceratosolen solmsi marchali TaxID=326594 RepID=A0AAJ6YKA8_9HYME|nr:PREDICTED: succinate dehydrogenase cytochrome b560 subunit, mitochondrial-like [Ceratosolen solmsi marchali]
MALNFTRLICRRNLYLNNFRCLYTSNPSRISTSAALMCCEPETYAQKNLRLARPLSPHLTIYQVQLTSFLSITHRASGVLLSLYGIFLGFGTLFIPGGIPCVIQVITNWNLPAALLYLGKALFAIPLTYHYSNGLRHLMWDLGKGLNMKEVYSSGWIVVAATLISALSLAAL